MAGLTSGSMEAHRGLQLQRPADHLDADRAVLVDEAQVLVATKQNLSDVVAEDELGLLHARERRGLDADPLEAPPEGRDRELVDQDRWRGAAVRRAAAAREAGPPR
jgi:hypothetical protein